MYGEDFDDGVDGDDDDDSKDGGEEVNSKKKKCLSKGAKPREILEDGSLYRLILTFFLQELRPFVSHLGTNPLAVELGTAGFLHEPIYNKLASIYNDRTHASLKLFVVNHDIYVTSGVQKEAPATFDVLSALAVSQGMDFINKHYHFAKYSPATTSRLMRIVQTGPTYFYTTIVFKSVATKFYQVWRFQSCLTV
jgi:hypothetical protein